MSFLSKLFFWRKPKQKEDEITRIVPTVPAIDVTFTDGTVYRSSNPNFQRGLAPSKPTRVHTAPKSQGLGRSGWDVGDTSQSVSHSSSSHSSCSSDSSSSSDSGSSGGCD